jgi:hypothetical protein
MILKDYPNLRDALVAEFSEDSIHAQLQDYGHMLAVSIHLGDRVYGIRTIALEDSVPYKNRRYIYRWFNKPIWEGYLYLRDFDEHERLNVVNLYNHRPHFHATRIDKPIIVPRKIPLDEVRVIVSTLKRGIYETI